MEDARGIKLVADVALFSKGRVLLVKYRDTGKYDHQAGWFLPDDHLRHLEHPEDGALRILREQVGVALERLDLRFIESFEGAGGWHLVFHYSGELSEPVPLVPGANTASAEWFEGSALPRRFEMAHLGWPLDVLAALQKPPGEVSHLRSVLDEPPPTPGTAQDAPSAF